MEHSTLRWHQLFDFFISLAEARVRQLGETKVRGPTMRWELEPLGGFYDQSILWGCAIKAYAQVIGVSTIPRYGLVFHDLSPSLIAKAGVGEFRNWSVLKQDDALGSGRGAAGQGWTW
ncbi:hypothetical protein U9M48_002004 [Paspalum notatum var. saurae]|uniref:Uncharacterized protein n=1 Tax=Paspalum notatum var. saurae TaxID=547442 RepID=A0AAQ3PIV8_PASNO